MTDKVNKVIREFGLSSISVDNKVTVFVLTVMIIAAGLFSYNTMPKAAFPDIIMPQIYIGTPYPGNSPEDIEKLITRPFEKEIKSIGDIDKISSTSIQGYSTILVEFDFSVPPTEAYRKVKDAVDKAMSNASFPQDLPTDPNIFEMNFSEFPILNVNLSGDFSTDQLKEYATYLEDEIEAIPEISKVDIRGVQDKEVRIEVDVHKMEAMKVSFRDIESAVQGENMTMSGGDMLTDNFRRNVRIVGDFNAIEEIEDIIIKQENFDIIYLRDVAKVNFGFEDAKSYAREYKQPVVMLDIVKRAGQNLIAATAKIRAVLAKAQQEKFPENLEITVTNDQSTMTRTMVDNLENSIISGVILVVLVLLFFLGLRNALFVGMAIPLSMFMSFVILNAMGVTINMMVLFGLILALGMLVDNGIVVVENIYRLMSEGMKPLQAAKEGAGEVAWPIIASTATTLAAFIPLAFWPGMMGQFMKFLPITLMIVLGSSLFVGLVINPVFTASFMKVSEEDKPMSRKKLITLGVLLLLGGIAGHFDYVFVSMMLSSIGLLGLLGSSIFIIKESEFREIFPSVVVLTLMGFMNHGLSSPAMGNALLFSAGFILLNFFVLFPLSTLFQENGVLWLENKYQMFLIFVLKGRRPWALLGGTFALLIFSVFLMYIIPPKTLFFPENMPKYLNIFIEKPIGADIELTNQATLEIEDLVIDHLSKYNDTTVVDGETIVKNFLIESVIAQVGEGTSDPARGPVFGNTPHMARIQVSFVDFTDRKGVNTTEVMDEMRIVVRNQFPGVKVTVAKNEDGPPQGAPINMELIGDDYAQLIEEAEGVRLFINSKNLRGIEELSLDIDVGKPEMIIEIDRMKAKRLNVSTGQIAVAIRTALFGKEISRYKEGEDDYPIQLRFNETYRFDSDALLNQLITFRDQTNGKIMQVPISAIAKPIKTSTFSAVKRKNMSRLITVSSNIMDGHNPAETVEKIKDVMKGYKLPNGVSLKFTGQMEEQEKEMAFLSKALMMAIFMIFLIIVMQFNSSSTPVIIVGSVILSLIGVLLGLVIFKMDFVIIMTMVGIISLAGVVVNNAIVLLDYTNLIMARRKLELAIENNQTLPLNEVVEAIIEGGKTRLRPVLLTAITTVLGLLPLATGMNIDFFSLFSDLNAHVYFGGDNAEMWGPMSWTVIFGLTFATFLTLVIVPIMFFLMTRLRYFMGRT